MKTAKRHYDDHLADYYAWSVGGFDAAIERGAEQLDALGVVATTGAAVLDLGAGFGMHAIPLARRGAAVTAVDGSALLLDQLRERAGDMSITTVTADIVDHVVTAVARFDLVLCMGDTLPHLSSEADAERFVRGAVARLGRGGAVAITLRDHTRVEPGQRRFIVVRGDATRIATCVLEYTDTWVHVHDLRHERAGDTWQLSTSSYTKLRLAPERIAAWLRDLDCDVRVEPTASGMVAVVGRRGAALSDPAPG